MPRPSRAEVSARRLVRAEVRAEDRDVRITDVDTIKLRLRHGRAMADAIHYMPERPTLLVQVHTDDGIIGLGESAAYGGSLESMARVVLDDLRRSCSARIRSMSSGSGAAWPPSPISAARAGC